jgi:hypothetical protein
VDDDRLNIWKILFARALELVDSLASMDMPLQDWTFGGGTVLMLRHQHRLSKDIDIFVPDPQWLPYLTPRLNQTAESLTTNYVEEHLSLKLRFEEGEIDFVASEPLTEDPHVVQTLLGREVRVETTTEIIAKKVWHRGDLFAGRDIIDLAMVAEWEAGALASIRPVLRDRRSAILDRIESQHAALREAFGAIDVLQYQRSFDECVDIVRKLLISI